MVDGVGEHTSASSSSLPWPWPSLPSPSPSLPSPSLPSSQQASAGGGAAPFVGNRAQPPDLTAVAGGSRSELVGLEGSGEVRVRGEEGELREGFKRG